MKKIIIPICLVLFCCIACTEKRNDNSNNQINSESMDKHDKEKIEQLLSEYKTSLNTSNAALAVSLYTKDGIFMPSEAPSAIGSDNIIGAYDFVFSQIQLNIDFFIEEIVIEENFAYATTTSKGTTLIHAINQTVPEENRELFIFERVNAEWKIARYIFNKMKPKE